MATSADGQSWQLVSSPGVSGGDPGAVPTREGGWLIVITGEPRAGTPSARLRRPGAVGPPPENTPREIRGQALEPPRDRTRDLERADRDFAAVQVCIPSSAAGAEGVAARMLIPPQPRFAGGAPVVINVIGGVLAGNALGRPEYVRHGFVEIHFAFPGGGQGDERSGGVYDFTCKRR